MPYRDRLKTWPKIGSTDIKGLRDFVDLLKQCESAKHSFSALKVLDDETENSEIIRRLPPWLARQWTRRVAQQREATGEFPDFHEFVEFLSQEDRIRS